MTNTIAVINQKGGVGKTTTSVNLAAGIAKKGFRVLLIDLDPQGHSTYGLGIELEEDSPSISTVLEEYNGDISQILLDTNQENLKLAPSDISLANTAKILHSRNFRESVLSKTLDPVQDDFDYIIIDCQPTLDVLPVNAVVASNRALVPTELGGNSLRGFSDLLTTIDELKGNTPDFDYRILPTRVTARYEETQLKAIKALKPVHNRILNTQIAENIAIGRSQMELDLHKPSPVISSEIRSRGARDYRALVKEIVEIWPPHSKSESKMLLQENQS